VYIGVRISSPDRGPALMFLFLFCNVKVGRGCNSYERIGLSLLSESEELYINHTMLLAA
jgi:hypothetical protein